jgi:DNA ligase-1
MKLATLYKQASTGKIQEWTISVSETTPGEATILAVYGQTDGKKQEARETITAGKNVGKSNETTYFEQACLEAQAQWEKKKKNKGYVESIEAAQAGERDALVAGGIDPMLAHKYADHASKVTWPNVFVQPKLDGHRCIAIIKDGVCKLWSRQRNLITGVPHINRQLEAALGHSTKTVILDGELYNHDYKNDHEKLTSFIRQQTPKLGHEVVQYWVYDLAEIKWDFGTRLVGLLHVQECLEQTNAQSIVIVPTFKCEDEGKMLAILEGFLKQGYEGLMVRNCLSLYKHGRSFDLQKVKKFQDDEFEIVDVVPGTGHMHDKGVFVCKTESGEEFKAKMVGPLDELRKYLDHKEDYIGEWLTVKFQKYSAKGIPVFGVALRVREEV